MKKLLYFILVSAFIFTIGCGQKSDDKNTKKEDNKNEQVKSDDKKIDNGSSDAPKSQDTKSDANTLGMAPGLPENFPKDIPQPGNSKCNGYINSSDGTVVTFESKDKLKDLIEMFKTEMKKSGYEIGEGGDTFVSEQGALLGFKKGDKEVGYLLGVDKEKNLTQIVITYK